MNDKQVQAAAAVGVVVGVAAVVAGAPVWGGMLAGATMVLVTKKVFDRVDKAT